MNPLMAKDIVFTPKTSRAVTPSQLETRIIRYIADHELPLVFLGFLGDFKGLKTRIALMCTRCGNRADKSATNLLNENKRCACVKSPNFQYKAGIPYLYVMRCGEVGKVGVTKSIIKRRVNLGLRNQGKEFDIVFAHEMDNMKDAFASERMIKKYLDIGGVGDIDYGKTETFLFNQKTLNNIKNLVKVG